MKKVYLIVQKKDVSSAVENLRDIATVHVEHQDELVGDELVELKEEVNMLTNALSILRLRELDFKQEKFPYRDWTDNVNDILELSAEIEHNKEEIRKKDVEIYQWKPWGDFNPQDIHALVHKGIYIYLAEVSDSAKVEFPAGVLSQLIHKEGKLSRFVLVSREELNLPYIVSSLPTVSLSDLVLEKEKLEIKVRESQEKIDAHCKHIDYLQNILLEREQELRLKETIVGMKEEGEIAILKGFCPADHCAELEAKSKNLHWGLLIEDPSDEDQVPTLTRNPKWIDIVKPVFGVINVLPGYRELDISFVFLVFFSIFFGILIGDAGYGAVFLILNFIIHNKMKNKVADQSPFILVYVLSVCAIIWGVLTGTVFGTLLLSSVIKPTLSWLTENKNVQLFCFAIGATHLSIAHLWRCARKFPTLSAFAEIGWALIIWGAFFIANMMIIGIPLMGFVKIILFLGVGLVILDILLGPRENIFVGLILFVFSTISAFTDVVSYVRLFAVGLAGVAVADAFNQMALSIGFNNVVSGIITSLILVVGHVFNIVLCGFGILVHGLRLNVLEFSGHLGLEWAGFKYEPLKKNQNVSL